MLPVADFTQNGCSSQMPQSMQYWYPLSASRSVVCSLGVR